MKKFLFVLMFITHSVFASNCPHLYPNPQKPIVSQTSIELCNSFYVVHYDINAMRPLFSSALVTVNGPNIKRSGTFKPDQRLPKLFRPEASDYTNSGFDRGHLTAAADADTDQEMADTFLLSNIVPQNPIVNRGVWKNLESSIRKSLTRDTIVVTGAIYRPWDLRRAFEYKYIGKNKIPVPFAIFKVVYSDVPVIWYVENTAGGKIIEISFSRLKTLTGINFKN